MKTVWSVLLSAVFVLLGGCSVLDPDQSVILPAIQLDVPATVSAAAPFTITLTLRTGGCTNFDRLAVEKFDTGVRIVPWGTNSNIGHKDTTCPTNIVDEPHTVQLEPPFSNPFQVSVEQGRLAPVVATVQVQ
jgi:hypothetical protein